MSGDTEARKMQVLGRTCPCGAKVTKYVFSSILIPFEMNAVEAVEDAGRCGLPDSLWFSMMMSSVSLSRIVLSSTCENCGRVEFWSCNETDWELFKSGELQKHGVSLFFMNSPFILEGIAEKSSSQPARRCAKNLIDSMKKRT